MERSTFNEPSLVCPYCGQRFAVTLVKGAEKAIAERIYDDAKRILREKWIQYQRSYRSDDENIAWLSGYKELMHDLDLSKYEALEFLKKSVAEAVL